MIKLCDFNEFLNVVKDFTKEDLIQTKLSLKKEGIDIESIEDLIENELEVLFTLLPDGTLQRVNLYIAEQIVSKYNQYELKPQYKYHIFKCNTIVEMFHKGRKHRYKINTRTDGTFYFRYISTTGKIIKENENEKIPICKNCLKKYFNLINKRYITSESDKYVEEFDLALFDKQFGSFFNHKEIKDLLQGDSNFAPNVYPKNWNQISKKIKEKRNYTCEKCGFKPKSEYEKKFIHLHHINGDKTNNHQDNLKVLCIKCHSEVDNFHTRIKSSSDYNEFIKLKKGE